LFEELLNIEPCKNKKYLAWIRERDCLVCGNPNTIAHHCEQILPSRGMAIKHDLLAVPLCVLCHAQVHATPDFWEFENTDIEKRIIFFLINYFGRKP
jgi:hypothetical protein